ncbi:MAG TPA: acetyl-CoA hydrolase/transferase C-terminal domain-containing protein [Rhizomicrobium sp.]|jgi:acyl-CoA hydrolase
MSDNSTVAGRAPAHFDNAEALAETIVREVGRDIVLGLPLGLGKANHIANALYARAAADRSIRLRIFTALTLEKPRYGSELERRFLAPVIERLFGGYPDLAYAKALRAGTLPPNIEVNEFFFLAGRWLGVLRAQQDYISAGYTHASRYLIERGVNVIAQLVAKRGEGADARYSLSCNTDITLDALQARAKGGAKFLLVGQVNSELPFMPGDGDLPAAAFAAMLDHPSTDFPLFAPPKPPIDLAEYAAGLRIAALIPDGGTLQIGIGEEGDAAVHALILRQTENAAFREALGRLDPQVAIPPSAQLGPFEQGLYAATEMLVDGYLHLKDAGILKREVDGALVDAAFFLGPKDFYRRLREMPEAERARFQMKAVSFTNRLYGGEESKRAARVGGRFVNSTMMATLLGEAVSDTLEDGRVVSGVGGQHDFVAQAFALADARSILTLKATRKSRGKPESNIRWSYGRMTIPRHLRDIFVTEYGVADLRGKSDAECIAAMLAIADSRFQPELARQAKDAGKLPRGYEIPGAHRDNTPERIARALEPLRARGLLPLFPLGTDFTPAEQRLVPALALLQDASQSRANLLSLALQGLSGGTSDAEALARLGLERPKSFSDRLYRLLVRAALARTQSQT